MPQQLTASVCVLDTKTDSQFSIHPSSRELMSYLITHATDNWSERNLQEVDSPDGLEPPEILAAFFAEGGDNQYLRGSVNFDPTAFQHIDELIQLRNILANLATSTESVNGGDTLDPSDSVETLDQLILMARRTASELND